MTMSANGEQGLPSKYAVFAPAGNALVCGALPHAGSQPSRFDQPILREDDIGGRSYPSFAGKHEPRPIGVHERLGDGESKASSGLFARRRVELMKGVHGKCDLVYGHADAVSVHAQSELAPFDQLDRDEHLTADIGELDGVGEEVKEDLLEPPPVGDDGRQVGGKRSTE